MKKVRSNWTYILSIGEVHSRSLIGGKGSELTNLVSRGVNVPPAFIVSTRALSEHVKLALAQGGDCRREHMGDLVRRTPLSKRLQREFTAAWRATIRGKAAIRSSATIEDSAALSYAGQFSTFLDVPTPSEGLRRMLECWASLFSKEAAAYRREHLREPIDQGNMPVIVQEMITPDYAGVAFTREPTSSDRVYYLEWVAGLGEELVSGRRVDGRAWLTPHGRTLRVDRLSNKSPTQKMLARLGRSIASVEKLSPFDAGNDVEWAVKDSAIWILQSRPITRIEASDSDLPRIWNLPGTPVGGWTQRHRDLFEMWDEYNPPAVRLLEFELWYAAVWQASLDMFRSERGRVPDIENVVLLADSIPIAIDPAARVSGKDRRWLRGKIDPDLRTVTASWVREAERFGKFLPLLTQMDRPGLFKLLLDCAEAHRNAVATRLMHMREWIVGEHDGVKRIKEAVGSIKVDEQSLLDHLRSGIDHETNRMNAELGVLLRALRSEGHTERWEADVDEFLEKYGHFDFQGKLLGACRNSFMEFLFEQRSVRGNIENRLSRGIQKYRRFLREMQGKLRPDRSDAFMAAVSILRNWIKLREDTKTLQNVMLPTIRRVLGEIGKRLNDTGIKGEDVYLLSLQELEGVLLQNQHFDKNLMLRRSKISLWKENRSWLPDSFRVERIGGTNSSALFGLPGSAGIAAGRAKVIRSPTEFRLVKRGDIVVAPATSPVWTQLFVRAAGIVVETGSRISHAALTAREYGIPAVVGATGIMNFARPGDILQIDGGTGMVKRVRDPGTK